MSESIVIKFELPVYPERVYRAWLTASEHACFTHRAAHIQPKVGIAFDTLDGQVQGKILSLVPHDQIHQTWQIQGHLAFDSRIEITLLPTCTGSELTLRHFGIQTGQSAAQMDWWVTHYLKPLRTYFEDLVGT